MAVTFEDIWEDVAEAVSSAEGIAFDGCHKIYVLMDSNQVHLTAGYGYGVEVDTLYTKQQMSETELLDTLKRWYKKAQNCGLQFIDKVSTMPENVDGFESLIYQGYEQEFCQHCGKFGANYDQYCDDCSDEFNSYDDEDDDEEEGV
jgi:hypothetical protein